MEEQKLKDGFVECPHCKSRLCYAQQLDDQETWMCFHCGYTSTTQMKEGTPVEKAVTEKHPNLYQDLKFVDPDGYVWYPAVLTVPGRGMLYIDGSSTADWQWAVTPMRTLTEKERKLKQFRNQEYAADMKRTKYYGKEGFIEAASDLGLFGNVEN